MAPTSNVKPIPDAYRRVTPALTVKGGAKALAFYKEVFRATERMSSGAQGGRSRMLKSRSAIRSSSSRTNRRREGRRHRHRMDSMARPASSSSTSRMRTQ
jgi:hypothetical protein